MQTTEFTCNRKSRQARCGRDANRFARLEWRCANPAWRQDVQSWTVWHQVRSGTPIVGAFSQSFAARENGAESTNVLHRIGRGDFWSGNCQSIGGPHTPSSWEILAVSVPSLFLFACLNCRRWISRRGTDYYRSCGLQDSQRRVTQDDPRSARKINPRRRPLARRS